MLLENQFCPGGSLDFSKESGKPAWGRRWGTRIKGKGCQVRSTYLKEVLVSIVDWLGHRDQGKRPEESTLEGEEEGCCMLLFLGCTVLCQKSSGPIGRGGQPWSDPEESRSTCRYRIDFLSSTTCACVFVGHHLPGRHPPHSNMPCTKLLVWRASQCYPFLPVDKVRSKVKPDLCDASTSWAF